MAEAQTVKKLPPDMEDEIALMRGTTSVLEVMESKYLEVVEGSLICLLLDIRGTRTAIKGQRMSKLDKEAFLEEIHEIENFVKDNFPPKVPSPTD